MEEKLADIPAVVPPRVREGCTHAYYVHACKFKEDFAQMSRNAFIDAVKTELPPFELRGGEGVKISYGYVKPLYLQPVFQKKIAYGSKGCPFVAPWYEGEVDYAKGTCPVTERMHEKELFIHEMMLPSMTERDLDDVVDAFEKVWEHRELLKGGQ